MYITLDWTCTRQAIYKIQKPMPLPVRPWTKDKQAAIKRKEEDDAMMAELYAEAGQAFDAALSTGQAEEVWEIWSDVLETFYFQTGQGMMRGHLEKGFRGRGGVPKRVKHLIQRRPGPIYLTQDQVAIRRRICIIPGETGSGHSCRSTIRGGYFCCYLLYFWLYASFGPGLGQAVPHWSPWECLRLPKWSFGTPKTGLGGPGVPLHRSLHCISHSEFWIWCRFSPNPLSHDPRAFALVPLSLDLVPLFFLFIPAGGIRVRPCLRTPQLCCCLLHFSPCPIRGSPNPSALLRESAFGEL